MADIIANPKARREYEILETFEAGLALRGSEVKSIRAGKANIRDAFVRIMDGEAWLLNAHIDEYEKANRFNHDPKAPRKLLLHKSEIRRLAGLASQKGATLVPLTFYWKNGKVKVSIGVGRGKREFDKRETIRRRETERMLKRALMRSLKQG